MSRFAASNTSPLLEALALINLSLGAAFGLSSVFSTGARLMEVLGARALMRLLQPYQQHLLSAFLSFWIPALLIYIVLRSTRADERLRCGALGQSTILAANLLLAIYVAARIFASTIEGGGPSFLVAQMSRFVLVPAWILLSIGFVALLVKSMRAFAPSTTTPRAGRSTAVDAVVVGAGLAAALVFGMTLPIGKAINTSSEFARVCRDAETKVLELIPRAKGVALHEDQFFLTSPRHRVETGPLAGFLLNQSLLEFVERPATKESGIEGRVRFERMTTQGERVLTSMPRSQSATRYTFDAIDDFAADYLVRSLSVDIPNGRELGLGGARIEVTRRADDQVIAYAQYYWNDTEFKVCPQEFDNGLAVFRFLVRALNVRNPDGPR